MDLLDRLLGHDCWTTNLLLEMCGSFTDTQLDQNFDIGPGTLRTTFDHIIWNMEAWSAAMDGSAAIPRPTDKSIAGLQQRLATAAERLRRIARRVAENNAWDELWTDRLDQPPNQKSFGTSIAHVITHSMHHRAQILNMLKCSGVTSLPEGDVFSWENAGVPLTSPVA
ncbi:MAG: DinB family protein [Planctomycetaceae bacterium]|nr:DinB family protein [Planctomycetaceae bacterium]